MVGVMRKGSYLTDDERIPPPFENGGLLRSKYMNIAIGSVLALQDGRLESGGWRVWKYDSLKNGLVVFRVGWEKFVAEWMDSNNIDWEYEGVNNIVKTPFGPYVPDFTLIGTNVLVEVKGRLLSNRQLKKIDWCIDHSYDVRIVDKENITNISLNVGWRQRQSGRQIVVPIEY